MTAKKIAIRRLGVVALAGTTAALAFSGCLENGSEVSDRYSFNRGRMQVALRAINDCPDLEQSFKDQMADRMLDEVEANRQNALDWVINREEYCYCWYGEDFDGSADVACGGYYDESDGTAGGVAPPANGAPGSGGTREGAGDYSTTNTQVAGVDEADFVKNDGSYVYMVSGDELIIFEAWPAANTTQIASVTIEGNPQRLYVDSDRAVIYSDIGQGQTCAYDDYYGSASIGGELKITVFDITDRAAPVLEREIRLSGTYSNSRRIGTAVHTVVTFPETFELNLTTWPDELYIWDCNADLTEDEVNAAFDQLLADNGAAIAAADLGDFLPSATDTDYRPDGSIVVGEGLFVDCQNFYEPQTTDNPGFLSVVSFDLTNDIGLSAATIFGRGGEVYASHQNLYVAVKEYLNSDGTYGWGDERTVIHKFGLDDSGNAPWYRASGDVPGRILNQFAMDELDGRLRLATTEGHLPSPDATNNIFVLEESICGNFGSLGDVMPPVGCDCVDCAPSQPLDLVLTTVGAIRGIAPTEDIRAVRFDGDHGFVVTFKKTDPLYAFDLSDPYNPVIAGELHIPGFSTYMHFLDADHLLTIGFDADDQGSFAWFTGIQLQIFDVSDLTQPTLTFKEVIGTRGSTSDATDDHMAFNYFASRDLLAIPMGICADSSGSGGSYGSTMTFNGLLVYHVTADQGFTLLGGVDHRDPTVTGYDCYNWWQNPDSQVKRSIFMEDFVFSISSEKLKVNNLLALDVDLVSTDLPQSSQPQDVGCGYW